MSKSTYARLTAARLETATYTLSRSHTHCRLLRRKDINLHALNSALSIYSPRRVSLWPTTCPKSTTLMPSSETKEQPAPIEKKSRPAQTSISLVDRQTSLQISLRIVSVDITCPNVSIDVHVRLTKSFVFWTHKITNYRNLSRLNVRLFISTSPT